MSYWFEDPTLKALAPLALSSSIKGLSTLFFTPRIYAGYNVIPQGPVIGPTTIDPLVNRCVKKRAFIVADEFNERNAKKAGEFLESGGFTTEIWAQTQPEAPMENVYDCTDVRQTIRTGSDYGRGRRIGDGSGERGLAVV